MKTKHVADLLFEARHLKNIPRSGFQFLGAGGESVAEHAFSTTFIAYVLSRLEPGLDSEKLVSLCLVHDLAESRIGDLNYVQKMYVKADEKEAVSDMTRNLPFGEHLAGLIQEFHEGESKEARLARDADQLALVLELKYLKDQGAPYPDKWLPHVLKRISTDAGKRLAEAILEREQDAWWMKGYNEDWRKGGDGG
jgi:putative hydrolases of HD superfamily